MSLSPTPARPSGRALRTRLAHIFEPVAGRFVAARVGGFVDRIVADEALGWAFDRKRPERRVLVVARLDGKIVAETLADLPRQDLVGAGKGDGRCGFRLKLPSGLSAEAKARLRIEGVSGLRRQPLKRATRFRDEPAPAKPALAAESPRGPAVGFLERCSGGVVKGWALDPNNPNAPARVDIFDDELFLGSAVASIERPRLRETGAPLGSRGFEFVVPAGRTVTPDRLRARIAGTRLDLRRSRAYPGDLGEAAPPQAKAPAAGQAPANAAAVSVRPDRVLMVVAGPGGAEAVETSLAAARAQDGVAAALRAGDAGALHSALAGARLVCVLSPGQRPAPGLARRLLDHAPGADVISWNGEGAAPLPAFDTDLMVRLGARTHGLAVAAHALTRFDDDFAGALAADLDALEAWASSGALSWAHIDEPLASPRPHPGPRTVAPEAPGLRRVSLAIWSGWSEAAPHTPPGLRALLAGCSGLDVEILAPPPLAAHLAQSLQPTPDLRSLSVRPAEAPPEFGPAGLWRALGEAATGQVVLFCDGRVEPSREAVARSSAWAMQPGIGGVTVNIGGALAGIEPLGDAAASTYDLALAGVDRPTPAAPAAFMAISRAALAQVGGFDHAASEAPADLDLGLRLRAAGRRSILLGSLDAAAPGGLVEAWAGRVVAPKRRA